MIGATYYNRRLEVDQLYVRQRENELTVNGELLWPKELKSWAQLALPRAAQCHHSRLERLRAVVRRDHRRFFRRLGG